MVTPGVIKRRRTGSPSSDQTNSSAVSTVMSQEIPVIAWSDWINSDKGDQDLPLLDLLPTSLSSGLLSYNNRLQQPSLIQGPLVSIPLSELRERSFELPPRNVEFAILVEHHAAKTTALEFLVPSSDKRQQQKPWKVIAVVLLDRKLQDSCQINQAGEKNIAAENESCAQSSSSQFPFVPDARLWQPDPMVQSILLPVLFDKLNEITRTYSQSNITSPVCYEIWDLGAGSGRDACFLAEQLKARLGNNHVNDFNNSLSQPRVPLYAPTILSTT
jgi:hypothetical protein